MVKVSPLWRNWLEHALPYLQGPRILEISFGTGYLLTPYAGRFEVCGIDYNRAVLKTVSYPPNRNWLGMSLARFWEATGDILRDMQALFNAMGMACTQKEIGGLGTVHLYVAEKS